MNNLEEVDPADEARTYRQAPLWRRLSVALAGSAMHFLIAAGGAVRHVLLDRGQRQLPHLGGIAPGLQPDRRDRRAHHRCQPGPAGRLPARRSDRGRRRSTFRQLGRAEQLHPGPRRPATRRRRSSATASWCTCSRCRSTATSAAVGAGAGPLPAARTGAPPVGFIGIVAEPRDPLQPRRRRSAGPAGRGCTSSALTLGRLRAPVHPARRQLVRPHAHQPEGGRQPRPGGVRFESPVGIVRLLHQAGQSGLPTVLWLLAVINLSLGIFNLLPLFPLDGGHVAVALYEGVRSRRRPEIPRRRDQAAAALLRSAWP